MGANAQTTVPTFVASQVLTAAQMNQSARTGVPVFANSTDRDAAFGGTGEKTLAEGQLAYLEDTNVVQYYDGAAWATLGPSTSAVVQVKSTAKTDTFTVSSTTFTDVTGLAQSITPTSATNKVLILVQMSLGNASTSMGLKLLRDSTDIYIGDASGALVQTSTAFTTSSGGHGSASIVFLDSPATTSATTYKIQMNSTNAAAAYLNRNNDNSQYRAASSITVFEVTP